MATVIYKLFKALQDWGFDLCQTVAIEDYNENVSDEHKIPLIPGRDSTMGILIGNSREVWPKFIKYCSENEDLLLNPDPFDTYTKIAFSSVLSNLSIGHFEYYCCDFNVGPLLYFQLMAEICGLCYRSQLSHMCYHHSYGHWIGLRGLVVLDMTFIHGVDLGNKGNFSICSECDTKYGKELTKWEGMDLIDIFRDPNVWLEFMKLRTICTHLISPYNFNQCCYHYSKDIRYIQADVDNFRKKNPLTVYNWVEKFNDGSLVPFTMIKDK